MAVAMYFSTELSVTPSCSAMRVYGSPSSRDNRNALRALGFRPSSMASTRTSASISSKRPSGDGAWGSGSVATAC